jgi:hypothetical protein
VPDVISSRLLRCGVRPSSGRPLRQFLRYSSHPETVFTNRRRLAATSTGTIHEWEFRTRWRVANKTGDNYVEAVSKVVEGLRGEVFVVAHEVGLSELWQEATGNVPSGITTLISQMKETVFPLATHAAKEIFRQYCKPSGPFSRQIRESMKQYVARHRRCWKILKELGPKIEFSECHRADDLLDLAGLDKNEKIMIQAAISNARDFEKVADALIVQHPRAHVREQWRRGPRKQGEGEGVGAGALWGELPYKSSRRRVYLADDDYQEEGDERDEHDPAAEPSESDGDAPGEEEPEVEQWRRLRIPSRRARRTT